MLANVEEFMDRPPAYDREWLEGATADVEMGSLSSPHRWWAETPAHKRKQASQQPTYQPHQAFNQQE